MNEHIFLPAGMTHTQPDVHEDIVPGRAAGYRRGKDGKLTNTRYVDLSNKLPSPIRLNVVRKCGSIRFEKFSLTHGRCEEGS